MNLHPPLFPLCLFSIATYSLTKLEHAYFLKCHDLHASVPLHMLFSLLECTSHFGMSKEMQRTKVQVFSFSSPDFLLCLTSVFWFVLCVTIPSLSLAT